MDSHQQGAESLAGWQSAPEGPGWYAVIEPVMSMGVNPFSVYRVTLAEDGKTMLYAGGLRRVDEVTPGTLWHRLADIPEDVLKGGGR